MAGRFFYNPPVVLVLDVHHKVGDSIRVAQVYDDIVLAGPGDLILSGEQAAEDGRFVECWNTYTLRCSQLGSHVGSVSSEVVQAVEQMEEDPHAVPDWACLTVPMKADDPRIHFRKIEVEVAYTFAVRAAVEPMALHEESPLTLFRQSPADLKKDIEAIIKRTCRLTMWYSV